MVLIPTLAVGLPVASVTVCLCARALKGKRLELSTPNLVHVYSTAVARQGLTREVKRWKVKVARLQKPSQSPNGHGRTVLTEAAKAAVCCCSDCCRFQYGEPPCNTSWRTSPPFEANDTIAEVGTADGYVMRFSWRLMASTKNSFHMSHASITKQLIPPCFVLRLFALSLSRNYSLFRISVLSANNREGGGDLVL